LQIKLPEYEQSLVRLLDKAMDQLPALGSKHAGLDDEMLGLEKGTKFAQAALGTLSNFLSQAFVVLIYLVFMLAERAGLRERLDKAFAAQRVQEIEDVIQRINAAITQYIVVKTCMGLLAGVLTAAVLLAFGVDYALLWGILAFLFNYIPYLGSIVASVLPVLLSLVQFEDPLVTLCILGLLLLVQNLIGYLIEPRLAGRRLDLSPLVIIVSLAFWGSLWGIIGMILAVPLVVVIKTILEHMLPTRPLARMLSNG
jgi:AI-2 transport protein TqsA